MAHEVIKMASGSIETGSTDLKISIEGDSKIPFWNHDLKVKAILALLDSIDVKHYHEDGLIKEANESYEQIIEYAK
ncbi:hypothetical protein [Lysinibacillus sp. IITD104]|uniref:hypothetical protein n=1 Tax=Lysinibacillus sp. IITD104 TaxID=3116650 RepID=UPI002FD6A240